MLFDGAEDVPGTGHPDGKGDEIPLADPHRLPALWRDDHLPLQDITGLRAIVAPGKDGDLFTPDWPGFYLERRESLRRRVVLHSNLHVSVLLSFQYAPSANGR